jgi:8-amino-7-oxononanoate synthase
MNAKILKKRQGCRGIIDGKEVIIFSSNDYLGLSSHPEVIKAAIKTAERYGIGTGGAPETTGTTDLHVALSKAVAAFKSRDIAYLFPSGYQANIAIHHALATEDTVFHIDERHHPSAMDGAKIGKKTPIFRFNHNDLTDLENNLKSNPGSRNVVSLPSVFTLDGDIAPLDKIADLKNKYDFILILDEAHATGCVGKTGRGLEEHLNLHGIAEFIMGSFSKALGSQGGFVVYNRSSEKWLKSKFRQFVYSTSLSTVSVAAALKALEVFTSDSSLYGNLLKSKSKIIEKCEESGVKLIVHDSMILLAHCDNLFDAVGRLLEDGFVVIPTKAYIGDERHDCLRITPMSLHTDEDIASFVDSLGRNLVRKPDY